MSFLGGLGSFGNWASGLLGSAGSWLNNNPVAAGILGHLSGAGVVTDTLAAASAIGSKLGGSSGYSDLEKLALLQAYNNANSGSTSEVKQSQSDADSGSAANIAAEQRQQQARNAETAGINAGLGKARAATVGSGTSANTYANAINNSRGAMSSQSASTQADYMEKLGQGMALKNQADNLSSSAKYAGLSGALQGGAAGMSMGATISDENAKQPSEDPIDDDKLIKAIEEFKELKARVDALKKESSCSD